MSFHLWKPILKKPLGAILVSGGAALLLALLLTSDMKEPVRQSEEWKERHMVVDRIEGKYALCENFKGGILRYCLNALPPDLLEGDVLEKIDGRLQINRVKTTLRRKLAEEKGGRSWER